MATANGTAPAVDPEFEWVQQELVDTPYAVVSKNQRVLETDYCRLLNDWMPRRRSCRQKPRGRDKPCGTLQMRKLGAGNFGITMLLLHKERKALVAGKFIPRGGMVSPSAPGTSQAGSAMCCSRHCPMQACTVLISSYTLMA